MIEYKIRAFKLYENNDYNYEAIFNIGYMNNNKIVIINGYRNTEKEAIENLDINVLERKEGFVVNDVKEVFLK